MAKFQSDTIYDDGTLAYLRQRVSRITLCSAQPSTYSDANSTTGVMLAKSGELTSTDFTLADGDVSGRKITVSAQNQVSVSASGTMTHAAWLSSSGSSLLAVTTVTSESIFTSDLINLPAYDFEIRDVSQTYIDIVLGVQPANLIAYWPLNETAGTNADNAEGTAARDGTYSGVTLNSADGPFGEERVGLWDGINDRAGIYSDSLRDAFDGDEGSFSIWGKVSGSGVWTDGITRWGISLRADASNRIFCGKSSTNNRFSAGRITGGSPVRSKDGITTTDWFHVVVTWTVSNDRVRMYWNGTQEGADMTGLSTYTGNLSTTATNIGAETDTTYRFDGYFAHAAVWTTELTAANVTTLYNGGPI